jgi:lipoyl synthase
MINPLPDKQKQKGKPGWLKRRLPSGPEYEKLKNLLKNHRLTTVCQQAKCPNQFECYSQGTATFMIMGEKCTRNCRFCAVGRGPDGPPDREEPARIAEAVELMGLRYVVVTSVTRDDLDDGGASLFAGTIRAIKGKMPTTRVEVLIPDLQGDWRGLATILQAEPDVLNHNIETVPRLYPLVRAGAEYLRSINLFRQAKRIAPAIPIKSGIMLGLGETEEEFIMTLEDLLAGGCDILTIGQYLQPSPAHLPVERFFTPEEFKTYKKLALNLGFAGVAAGPFVRSSYNAEKLYQQTVGIPAS